MLVHVDHKSCVKLLEEYLGSHNVDADHDVSVAETFVSLFADNLVKMSALHKPSPGDDDFFTQDNYAVQHGLLEMEQLYSQSDSVKCKDTTSPSILLEKSLDNAEGFLGYQSEGELYTTALDITSQSHNSADVSVPVQCIHTTATSEDEIVTVPEEIEELSNPMLRKELLALGEYPGPVTETTRTAYMMYLMKLRNGVQPAGNKGYKGTCTYMVYIHRSRTDVHAHRAHVYRKEGWDTHALRMRLGKVLLCLFLK